MDSGIVTAVVAAVPASIAAGAAVIAARHGAENASAIGEVRNTADRVERQTNGEMDAKIKRAVMEVFSEHKGDVTQAVMAESVRHLLNAMINPDEYANPYPKDRL